MRACDCHPVITPAAGAALTDAYVAMRQLGDDIRAQERRITFDRLDGTVRNNTL
jgi:DNA replicative helicase MCM subunit Mcm2 (Cdc46/Mcm family)